MPLASPGLKTSIWSVQPTTQDACYSTELTSINAAVYLLMLQAPPHPSGWWDAFHDLPRHYGDMPELLEIREG